VRTDVGSPTLLGEVRRTSWLGGFNFERKSAWQKEARRIGKASAIRTTEGRYLGVEMDRNAIGLFSSEPELGMGL
jgi:hypothetical protein